MSEDKTMLPVVAGQGGDISLYVREIKQHPVLSREQEQEYARRWHDDRDPEAFRMLVISNLRFVVKVANEYRRYGFRLQDLVQEGNVGLIKAVVKFNPYRGYRLISYAVWWIRAQIHDYILRNWSMVKIGTTQLQRKLFYKLQNAQSQLKEKLDAEASDSERERAAEETIAEILDTDVETVREFRSRMQRRDLSLETPLSEDGNLVLGDQVAISDDDQSEILEGVQSLSTLQEVIAEVRATLSERDLYILDHRILSESPETLDEIGARYGVSKERIRQLEKRIRGKIVDRGRARFTEARALLPA